MFRFFPIKRSKFCHINELNNLDEMPESFGETSGDASTNEYINANENDLIHFGQFSQIFMKKIDVQRTHCEF